MVLSALEKLVNKRTSLMTRAQAIEPILANHATTALTEIEMDVHLEGLNQLLEKLEELNDEIMDKCNAADELAAHATEFDLIERKIKQLIISGRTIKKSFVVPSTSSSSNSSSRVKLPPIQLPYFDGKYADWSSFRDLFEAMVKNDSSLSGAQKIQYLKTSLRGEPARLISTFQITNSNFDEAWTSLNDRYNNERDQVNGILKRLFGQPCLTKESAISLQKLLDVTNECIRALTVLNRPVEHWDDILIFMLTERLDNESRRKWAMSLTGTKQPTIKEFYEFMERHVRGLHASTDGVKSQSTGSGGDRRQAASHHSSVDNCALCKGNHQIFSCKKFKSLSSNERYEKVKSLFLCFKCLKGDHRISQCKSQRTCNTCDKPHHTILHFEKKPSESNQNSGNSESTAVASFFIEHGNTSTQVLLSTVLVKVSDQYGNKQVCRALLDGGSEASFITESCVRSLGLRRQKSNITICGISSSHVGAAKGYVNLLLHSCVNNLKVNLGAHILPKITGNLPKVACNTIAWNHIAKLQLADPKFYQPGPIDILLGADITGAIMRDGRREGGKLSPIAQNSIFGWFLSGRVRSESQQRIQVHYADCETNEILRKFWEIEEIPAVKFLTPEEKACEKHFVESHHRESDGRYVVKIPFKESISQLGSSKERAVNRLKQVERRLSSLPERWTEYVKFMKEYQELGHMIAVPRNELSKFSYYLPHHFVLKDDSTTTKFRVVFDGSAKTSSGLSLNQCTMVGPTIQNDLFTLMIRFRFHLIALKADISKMYRQFKVNEEHQDFQRIVWREKPTDPIKDFRLTTVTYGTAAGSFLSTRCLKQLAEDEKDKFPKAAEVLMRDFYVDDLMSGESTTQRAIQLQQQLCDLVKCGRMELRKFATNDANVLKQIPVEFRETESLLAMDKESSIKALGIRWNPSSDKFMFLVTTSDLNNKATKRIILSELAKVFDPLGWLSPTTIKAKIIFQDLWKLSLNWDDDLPASVQNEWESYQAELSSIKSIEIPRCLIIPHMTCQQLHGFCDASEKAYSACVYLRAQSADGNVVVRLIAAKTKVAPIKQLSLPRLELCGAVLLTKLIQVIKHSINYCGDIFAWTDSTIVLNWLNAFPGKWKTFVANRVAEIQDLIPFENWHHVVSEENPADCASRGISAVELNNFSLWWHGPQWLKNSTFPFVTPDIKNGSTYLEEKKITVLTSQVCIEPDLVKTFSALQKLKRVTAYCLRFIHNLKSKLSERKKGDLTCEEIAAAFNHWIIIAQSSEFANELKCLKSSKPMPTSSKLLQLNPFLDSFGILRVGGRLQKANIPESMRHQIILPHQHHLTKLIIEQCHLANLHAGFQLLWATLNREYWILRARDTIRHVVRRCVICRRQRAETNQQLMGSLPTPRINPGQPFQNCGVDYAGPFNIRVIKGRSNKTFKGYFSIFICLAVKAIHLEAVSELSTEAFVSAFKRFISRRGLPSHMYSDCGTNFVGADNELKQLLESAQHNSKLEKHLIDRGIQWHFNPPSAPHHGGLWEAGVKSVKFHMKRVIGSTALTFEEFQTLLCQIEGCLNSRPLSAMSSDPMDFSVLTPGHFLIGKPLTAIPEPDLTPTKPNRLSKWQLTQQLSQHFWRRWNAEYLTTLQQRFKWKTKRENLQVGDLVIIKDEQLPPTKWKLGRITTLHPGEDSCVRVVTVKTSSGELKRPIVKLCPILYNQES